MSKVSHMLGCANLVPRAFLLVLCFGKECMGGDFVHTIGSGVRVNALRVRCVFLDTSHCV